MDQPPRGDILDLQEALARHASTVMLHMEQAILEAGGDTWGPETRRRVVTQAADTMINDFVQLDDRFVIEIEQGLNDMAVEALSCYVVARSRALFMADRRAINEAAMR